MYTWAYGSGFWWKKDAGSKENFRFWGFVEFVHISSNMDTEPVIFLKNPGRP